MYMLKVISTSAIISDIHFLRIIDESSRRSGVDLSTRVAFSLLSAKAHITNRVHGNFTCAYQLSDVKNKTEKSKNVKCVADLNEPLSLRIPISLQLVMYVCWIVVGPQKSVGNQFSISDMQFYFLFPPFFSLNR